MSMSSCRRSCRRFPLATAGVIALCALVAAGCTQGKGIEAPPQVDLREPPQTAMEVLERVVEAYHQADRYQDAGRLIVRYIQDGETFTETSKFSLCLAGPNRIRLRAYNALAVCDGQTFRATIDEAPGEVLSVAAPDELSPAAVYGDQVLGKALNQIVGSVPLSLFLDPDPLPTLLFNAHPPELDPTEKIGADNCYRVRIDRREGAFVLWIDEQTFVARRVEYPTGGCRRVLEPYPGAFSAMTITAEHDGARLDPPVDDDIFRLDLRKGVELVKRFDLVRMGARIPKFKFRALDGRQITRDSLADKIAVIKFWQKNAVVKFHNDLSDFEQIQKRYQDEDSVVFLAVSTDPAEMSDDDLKAALAKAGVSLEIARVDVSVAFRSFGLQAVPTTVILGRDGSLQEHLVGLNPNQARTLPKKIDTLLSGGDLILEAPEEPPNYSFYAGFSWQDFPNPKEASAAAAWGRAEIAPPSEPKLLRLKRLWVCSELQQPGNILVVPDDSANDTVLVVDGPSSVAEIGADGKLSATHQLELPAGGDAAIAFLRTAADGVGNRYFLGAKPGAKQLHLFDAGWKRLLSFPESGDHPGISDAILTDLDGDGELEMAVGYFGAVGVHCVGLDGERLWRNRAAENVFRLAATEPDARGQRRLLVAQGVLLPIDSAGSEERPIVLRDAFLGLIFTADLDRDGVSEWCTIAGKATAPGKLGAAMAVGLSPRGNELWRYPLPAGMHQHIAIEMVTAGNLLGGEVGQWVIAGADGSIHILWIDGTPIDHFNCGAAPSGMAVANLDGRPALLIATDEAVEAWQFEIPRLDEQTRDAE